MNKLSKESESFVGNWGVHVYLLLFQETLIKVSIHVEQSIQKVGIHPPNHKWWKTYAGLLQY